MFSTESRFLHDLYFFPPNNLIDQDKKDLYVIHPLKDLHMDVHANLEASF